MEKNELMKKIILATGSERKKRLFALLGLNFDIVDHLFDEKSIRMGNPEEHVSAIAKGKVDSIAHLYPNSIIIGMDTVVSHRDRILEKPIDKNDAIEMLKYLNGSIHTVVTGLYIQDTTNNTTSASTVVTEIHFKQLDESEIASYVEKEDVLDIAGAYDHESLGSVLLKKINGDYYNSIGLPLSVLSDELKKLDISVL